MSLKISVEKVKDDDADRCYHCSKSFQGELVGIYRLNWGALYGLMLCQQCAFIVSNELNDAAAGTHSREVKKTWVAA